MVEDNILGSAISTTNVIDGFSIFGEVLLYGFFVLVFVGLIFLVYYWTTFKHTLIIRDIANGRKIISKVRWKAKRGKDSNIWLVTPFNRIKKPLPPSNAVELTGRGRKFVEAYRGEDSDSLIWIEDNFDYHEFREKEGDSFQPLTTQERELLIGQVAKSHAYKKKTTWEMITTISLFLAPIIMLAVIGITLGDITDALTQYSQPLTSTLETTSRAFVTASNNLAGIQVPDTIINSSGVPN